MTSYVSNQKEWEKYFGKEGILSNKILSELQQAGADTKKVFFYNYYAEEYRPLAGFDYIIIPGGDAVLGIERIKSSFLYRELTAYRGKIIAYSAGALLLLKEYFLSPNYYYKELTFHKGLGIIDSDFTLEVHFDNSVQMRENIQAACEALKLPIIAIGNDGGISYNTLCTRPKAVGTVEFFPVTHK